MLTDEASRHHGDAQATNFIHIRSNGHGALRIVLAQLLHGYILIVHDNVIEELCPHMLDEGLHMLIGTVAIGFTGLRHHVTDVYFHGLRFQNSLTNAIHQEIRNNTGVEAAGPKNEHIGLGNGLHCTLGSSCILGQHHHLSNAFMGLGNLGFTGDFRAIKHARPQLDIGQSGRNNATAHL